eukprot:14461028-Alexandrium_andersonii.AAC.1
MAGHLGDGGGAGHDARGVRLSEGSSSGPCAVLSDGSEVEASRGHFRASEGEIEVVCAWA